jgi:hypothetical protein
MDIPYVIDNQTHKLPDVLNGLLVEHKGNSLDIAQAIRFLGKPLSFTLVKELKKLHAEFQKDPADVPLFVDRICSMAEKFGSTEETRAESAPELQRKDLRLICFDHICS